MYHFSKKLLFEFVVKPLRYYRNAVCNVGKLFIFAKMFGRPDVVRGKFNNHENKKNRPKINYYINYIIISVLKLLKRHKSTRTFFFIRRFI